MKCSNHFPMQIYNYNFSYTTILIVFFQKKLTLQQKGFDS